MFGNFDNIQKMSKTNLDTTMESLDVLSKNAVTISTEMTGYWKRSFENATKATEKLFGVKSMDTAIKVQSEYAKTTYDDFNAQMTKFGELYADLAKVAFKHYENLVPRQALTK